MFTLLTCCAAKTAASFDWLKLVEVIATFMIGLAGLGWLGNVLVEKARRKSVVRKYRVFLCYSAWALQDRINSIFHKGFAKYYLGKDQYWDRFDNVYAANAVNYTVFLFCQFFAWREIVDREMYNFRFRRWSLDSKVLKKLIDIEHWFSTGSGCLGLSSDKDMENFMIFRGEQRALGDMCVRFNTNTNVYECISFSEFIKKRNILDYECRLSLEKLEEDVSELLKVKKKLLDEEKKSPDAKQKLNAPLREKYKRLLIIRNLLIELHNKLDRNRTKKQHPKGLDPEDVDICATCESTDKCQREKMICDPTYPSKKTPAEKRKFFVKREVRFICDKFSCNRK